MYSSDEECICEGNVMSQFTYIQSVFFPEASSKHIPYCKLGLKIYGRERRYDIFLTLDQIVLGITCMFGHMGISVEYPNIVIPILLHLIIESGKGI